MHACGSFSAAKASRVANWPSTAGEDERAGAEGEDDWADLEAVADADEDGADAESGDTGNDA